MRAGPAERVTGEHVNSGRSRCAGSAPTAEGRAIGLDLGSRRIGVAVSDDERTVASALAVVPEGPLTDDHAQLAEVVAETGANMVVVGLPLSLSGPGPAARAVEAEVTSCDGRSRSRLRCCDERFSTVIATGRCRRGRRPAARPKWSTRWRPQPSCRPGWTGGTPARAVGPCGLCAE